MDINLNEFDLIPVTGVKKVVSPKTETLYDITVDGNHTFFVQLPNTNKQVLMHNCDGSNIASMLFGWWKRLAPELFNNQKIYKLNTPVVILKDNKDKLQKWFFTIDEFKTWEKANPNSNLKVIYLKGLGSGAIEDLSYIIAHTPNGFDGLLDEFYLDPDSDQLFEDWLGNDAEPRKKYLQEYTFDMDML